MNQEPPSLFNHVKTVHDSYPCNNISQNNSKTRKSLKITGIYFLNIVLIINYNYSFCYINVVDSR